MTAQCDCGSPTDPADRWFGIHSKGCAALKIVTCPDCGATDTSHSGIVMRCEECADRARRERSGERRIDLHLIDRFLDREIAKNGGKVPDYLIPMDLFALQNLAEAHIRQRDDRFDDERERDEQELGSRPMTDDRERYGESQIMTGVE